MAREEKVSKGSALKVMGFLLVGAMAGAWGCGEDVASRGEEAWPLHDELEEAVTPTELPPTGSAYLSVQPPALRFHSSEPGEVEHQVVTLRNTGSAPLEIASAVVASVDQDTFSLLYLDPERPEDLSRASVNPPKQLAPDETRQLRVTYVRPDRSSSAATLVVRTDAEETPVRRVLLEVEASATPCLDWRVRPWRSDRVIDFGPVIVHRYAELELTLINCSTSLDTTVKELSIKEDHTDRFAFISRTFPDEIGRGGVHLAPGEERALGLIYYPAQLGVDEASLHIVTEYQTRRVMLRGEGVEMF